METLDFLQKVWPDSGYYFIDTPSPSGHGFKHHMCESIEEAAARALHLDKQGITVYFACSSFNQPSIEVPNAKKPGETKLVYRVQDNVKLVNAFWLDLDVGCGPSEERIPNKYPTQREAIVGLDHFIREAGLPRPMVVSSGYGVHVYWALTETLLPGRWKYIAEKLKSLAAGLGLLADPSRTCDTASVLRPPGTHNYKVKDGVPAVRPVVLLLDADPVDPIDFEKRLDRASKVHGTKAPVIRKVDTSVNIGAVNSNEYPNSTPERIVTKCQQVKLMRDKGGDIPEPLWYSVLQLLHFAKGGDEAIHAWSKPYAGYSEEETQKKIDQITAMGPSTCITLEARNPDGCKGCPFKGTVTSPIQLGVEVEDKPTEKVMTLTELGEVEVEIPSPPVPFRRTTTGLFFDMDGVPIRFYRNDMFPMGLVWDDADGHMTVAARHELPKEGWIDFTFPASVTSSQKDFETLLIGQGILPDNMKYMRAYMSSYLQELQNNVKMQRLYDSLGWKDDVNFVLGRRIFTPDTVLHAGLSRVVPGPVVEGLRAKGDINVWINTVSKLTRPGLEAHLFAFCTGYASPLLSITGFDGCLLSMLGESNSGKTLSARMALSIYGEFKLLQSGATDTMNARMERLNAMANLPVYIDEITNIDPKQLSNLVYMLSQGRGREKLRSDSTTRSAAHWSAIAMSSSNRSLYTILAQGKDDSEAEMMRVLEITVPKLSWYESEMTEIFETIRENYGLAGEHYIQHVVRTRAVSAERIKQLSAAFVKATGFEGKERFWTSLCACVMFGFVASYECGLMRPADFQETFTRLFKWTCDTITGLRGEVKTNIVDEVAGLGQYVNMHQSGSIVVYDVQLGAKTAVAIRKRPTGPLVMRVEEDKSLMWIDRKHFKAYLAEHHLHYDKIKKHLRRVGALLDEDARKCLGGGTSEFRSPQIPCWLVDLKAASITKEI